MEDNKLDGNAGTGVGGKRKYRRHPKVRDSPRELFRPFGSIFQSVFTNGAIS